MPSLNFKALPIVWTVSYLALAILNAWLTISLRSGWSASATYACPDPSLGVHCLVNGEPVAIASLEDQETPTRASTRVGGCRTVVAF
jgi:hypothetical protein